VTRSAEQHEQKPDLRFKARLTVCDGPDATRTVVDYVVNMSTGGMFIETAELLPVGTPIKVELMLAGSETPITCTARVAWTNGPENLKKKSLPHGMGLQFLTPLGR
jgi:uncharacterized protein (TIGR02266 family)